MFSRCGDKDKAKKETTPVTKKGKVSKLKKADPSEIQQFYALKNINDAPEAIIKASQAVILIENKSSRGTGVFISEDGLLMTNHHVLGNENCTIEGCYSTLLFDYQIGKKHSRKIFFLEPVYSRKSDDVAIYRVYENKDEPYRPNHWIKPDFLQARELMEGDLYVVGHPFGNLKKFSVGEFLYDLGKQIVTSIFIVKGNSGSPVFTSDGKFVAIAFAADSHLPTISRTGLNFKSNLKLFNSIFEGKDSLDAVLEGATVEDIISYNDIKTFDDFVRYADITSSLKLWKLDSVKGEDIHIADILLEGCDIDHPSVCLDMMYWVECRPSYRQKHEKCFDEETLANLRKTFLRIFDKSVIDRGFISSIDWVGNYLSKLYPYSMKNDFIEKVNRIGEALNTHNPPLTLELATSLIYFGYNNVNPYYRDTNLLEFVMNYKKQPNYKFKLKHVCNALKNAADREWIDKDVFREQVVGVLNDEQIGIYDYLFCESQLYKSDLL